MNVYAVYEEYDFWKVCKTYKGAKAVIREALDKHAKDAKELNDEPFIFESSFRIEEIELLD